MVVVLSGRVWVGFGLVLVFVLGWFLRGWLFAGEATYLPVSQTLAVKQVVLFPGKGNGKASLAVLERQLKLDGFRVFVVDNGVKDLTEHAHDAVGFIEGLPVGEPVGLIGYSAGGVTARLTAGMLPGRVTRVVSVSSPQHGTVLADFGKTSAACDVVCRQLATSSPVLETLNEPVDHVYSLLSLYSRDDEVVRPYDSSMVPGAYNVLYQDYCNTERKHDGLVSDPEISSTISGFLLADSATYQPTVACI